MTGDLSGWDFEVEEVSSNVYRVTGRDPGGRQVARTGTNPDVLLAQCKRDALEISEGHGSTTESPDGR